MMKKLFFILCMVLGAAAAPAQSIYDFKVTSDEGKEVKLSAYKGKVLLIVNTATRCGFTPQYTELEALYEKYRDRGLVILDFPCNQFGQQAPGTIAEIRQFCTSKYNVQFPQFEKIEVNGPNESPLFTFLKAQKGFAGFDLSDRTGKFLHERFAKQDPDYAKDPSIKWNFTKFLVASDGRVLKRYEPTAKIADIEADVAKEVK